MTSYGRPFVAALLCSVVVFGRAPAWWHVATCDGHPHVDHRDADDRDANHHDHDQAGHDHHGHHHDHVDAADEKPPAPAPHDGRDCAICQSLAAPTGVTWDLIVQLPVDRTAEPLIASPVAALPLESISITHPRGPPVVA